MGKEVVRKMEMIDRKSEEKKKDKNVQSLRKKNKPKSNSP